MRRAGGARLALAQHRLTPLGADAVGAAALADPGVRALRQRGRRRSESCTLLRRRVRVDRSTSATPARRSYSPTPAGAATTSPNYSADMLARLARHRAALTPPEYASLLDDIHALVRAGAVDAARRRWNGSAHGGALARPSRDASGGRRSRRSWGEPVSPTRARRAFAAFVRETFGAARAGAGIRPTAGRKRRRPAHAPVDTGPLRRARRPGALGRGAPARARMDRRP